MTAADGYVLERDEGQAIWFLGTRMTVKAGGEATAGAFTIIDQECPPDFAAPMHIHRLEDELFYVLEGALRVTCDDRTWLAGAGALVFLPKGRPHQFMVQQGQPARLLQITAPAQFERFVAEVGVPATRPGLPDPELPDLDRLLAAAARHGIDILPPDDG